MHALEAAGLPAMALEALSIAKALCQGELFCHAFVSSCLLACVCADCVMLLPRT